MKKAKQTGDNLKHSKEEMSMRWLHLAASAGHGRAMCFLGNLLLSKGTKEEACQAIDWYKKAIALPVPQNDALFNLATLYFEGHEIAGVDMNLSQSFYLFQQAAAGGDISAMFWLGHCYSTGEGGVGLVNPCLAVQYLDEAAKFGHPSAHFHLASIYRTGLLSADSSSSSSRCCGGAASGSACGCACTSPAPVPADSKKFRHHLDAAVGLGDVDALFCLGDMALHGLDDQPVDEAKAVLLLQQASNGGHAQAALALGVVHYNGLPGAGVAKDRNQAFQYYTVAAERGSQEAWRNLAAMHFTGDGVPKNENTAREIMRLIFGRNNAAPSSAQ